MEFALLSLSLLFYACGVVLAFFGTQRSVAGLHGAATAVLAVAWLAHLLALVAHTAAAGHVPLSNIAEFLLVLGWLVLTLHLAVWLRWRVDIATLVLPPLAALMVICSIGLLPGSHEPAPYSTTHGWFVAHTAAATLGLAALGVAFAMSLIYLVQDRALKSKRSLRLLERLPSLETSDRIGQQAILWGFPLLTLGIVTGIVRNLTAHHRLLMATPKQIFPLLAWGLFALLLYSRLARGYHGRRTAYLTIAGFLIGLLAILGIAR